jgi:hypothetical protein
MALYRNNLSVGMPPDRVKDVQGPAIARSPHVASDGQRSGGVAAPNRSRLRRCLAVSSLIVAAVPQILYRGIGSVAGSLGVTSQEVLAFGAS